MGFGFIGAAAAGVIAQAVASTTPSGPPSFISGPLPERILWHASAGCITEAELRNAVAGQLHQSPESLVRRVNGSLDQRESEFVVVFDVYEGSQPIGRRTLRLTGGDCRAHSDTISFVLTLVLEGGAADEPMETPPFEPKSPPVPDSEVASTSNQNPAVPLGRQKAKNKQDPRPKSDREPPGLRETETTQWWLALGMHARPWFLPNATLAVTGESGVILAGRWAVSVGANFQLPSSYGKPSGERVALTGGGAGIEACYLMPLRPLRLGPCAGFNIDVRVAEGSGFASNRSTTVLEPDARVGARIDYFVSRAFFAKLLVGAAMGLEPHDYGSAGPGGITLFSQPQFFPYLGFSLGATLTP